MFDTLLNGPRRSAAGPLAARISQSTIDDIKAAGRPAVVSAV